MKNFLRQLFIDESHSLHSKHIYWRYIMDGSPEVHRKTDVKKFDNFFCRMKLLGRKLRTEHTKVSHFYVFFFYNSSSILSRLFVVGILKHRA